MKILNIEELKCLNHSTELSVGNYVRPDDVEVTEFRDEYDDLRDKITEETKETLMETIKSKGWKYMKSEEIPSLLGTHLLLRELNLIEKIDRIIDVQMEII